MPSLRQFISRAKDEGMGLCEWHRKGQTCIYQNNVYWMAVTITVTIIIIIIIR